MTTAPYPRGGAGPTAGFLFADRFGGELFKLDATTGALQYSGAPIATGITTVTVDPLTGYLYAAQGSEVLIYDASGPSEATLIESIPAASTVTGIAVDGAAKKLYVAREGSPNIDVYAVLVLPEAITEAATQIEKTTATLNGTLDPEGVAVTECFFEYGKTESYGQSAPCETLDGAPIAGPGEIPIDEEPHSVSADLSGLDPNTTYHYRLVVGNATAADEGEDETFETLGPPLVKCDFVFKPKPPALPIRCESVLEVDASEAKVASFVAPRGEETEVALEYVSEAKFLESGYAEASLAPSPATQINEEGEFFEIEGVKFVEFDQELSGLAPETTYHFRILANNQVDPPVHGQDKTLATFPIATGLPEGRAWELVSPAQRMGEVFAPEQGARVGLGGSCRSCTPGWSAPKAPMQSSPDGDAVAYEGEPFTTGLAAEANSYVSRRPEEGGWQTTPLSTPQLEEQVFKGFSPDLSKAIMVQSEPSLTPQAPVDFANLYLREEGKGLTTLITEEPPNRFAGTKSPNSFRVTYAGANAGTEAIPAFTHVVFQANDALSAEEAGIAPEAPEVGAEETDLYEWSGGELHLINVLPGNAAAAPNAVIGSGPLLAEGAENFDFDHAISDDGSRVFWSEKPSGQVYVREGGERPSRSPTPASSSPPPPTARRCCSTTGDLWPRRRKPHRPDRRAGRLPGHRGGKRGPLAHLLRRHRSADAARRGKRQRRSGRRREAEPLPLRRRGAQLHRSAGGVR